MKKWDLRESTIAPKDREILGGYCAAWGVVPEIAGGVVRFYRPTGEGPQLIGALWRADSQKCPQAWEFVGFDGPQVYRAGSRAGFVDALRDAQGAGWAA